MPTIYGLHDEAGELRYVGKANHLNARLKSHLRDARHRETPLYHWMRKTIDDGKRIGVSVLRVCDDWKSIEREEIAKARASGVRLLNLADGGDEPKCPPQMRSDNAKRMNQILRETGAGELRKKKLILSSLLRNGLVRNSARARLRESARVNSRLFGLWASIPDREENADGSPVGGYGRIEGKGYGAPQQTLARITERNL